MLNKVQKSYKNLRKENGVTALGAVLLIALAISILISIFATAFWAIWHIWMFVISQLFPTAPEAVQHPSFGLFVATWFLFGVLKRKIFPSKPILEISK